MLSDKELLKQFNKHKDITEYGLSLQFDYARRAHRFYSGDQGIYAAEVSSYSGDKQVIVFNKVMPYVDAVSGFMRQLRRVAEYSAREQEDEEMQLKSKTLNAGAAELRENANVDFYESDQDKELLITGYGAVDSNVSYELNPDGDVRAEVISYEDLGWDPQACAPNILDARWIYRRRKYSEEEAEKRFKGSKPQDFDAVKDQYKQKVFNPFDGEYTAIAIENTNQEDLVQVYYYQWWELQTYYRANNPLMDLDPELAQRMLSLIDIVKENRANEADEYVKDDLFTFDPTAKSWSMTPEIKKDVVEALVQFGITLEVQEYLKRCFYTGIVSETKVFTKFKSPNQDGFTIKVKTGNYDKELKLWYGMVRQLQEPSRYANKALTEILYTIAFNSKGGVLYEKAAVDDPQRFERQYASTKAAIQVNDGALSGGTIQPKGQAYLPTGFENVYQISNDSLSEVGPNKEFLGSSENKQVSALLEAQRIKQASSQLGGYLDSVSLYQIEFARILLTWMRILADNRPRPVKIKNEEGVTSINYLHKDLLDEEYGIKISEALPSQAQAAETGTILLTVAQQVALLGKNIYPMVVEYIPGLKLEDKKKLQQMLNPDPSPEQIQEQQQMKQVTLQGQKAKIEKDIADAQYKFASVDREKAETARTLGEAHQKNMENQLIKKIPLDHMNLTI